MTAAQESKARGWFLTAVTIIVIAVIIAVVTSCGSGSTRTRTVIVPAARSSTQDPPSATLNFTPTSLADAAHGTVTATPSGKTDILLTITVTVPNTPNYGIALWSDKDHWVGLYTGAKGTNSQTMAINPETLVRYKLLEVGLQIVHGRVIGHGLLRVDSKSVRYEDLLQVSTGELLNSLLAARQ